jgi:branched-chain amino acid transport system substrate-binding protein
VVAFESYVSGEKDFASPLARIRDAKPDVVFLPNLYTEVPHQIRQARKLGSRPCSSAAIPGHGGDPEVVRRGLRGQLLQFPLLRGHEYAGGEDFRGGLRKTYGTMPDDVAALTYDSFGLLRQALRTAGRLDRLAVRDALARIPEYEGVTGIMQFRKAPGIRSRAPS